LRRAFETVVGRHQALRTTFATNARLAGLDSQPYQLISANGTGRFTALDLRRVSEQNREQTAAELARNETRRPFDLTLGPLVRLTLLDFGGDTRVLVLNTHGIVCDDTSIAIVFDEMWECYRALCRGERPNLDPSPIQYVDVAAAQRKTLQPDEDSVLDFWRTTLAGAPARLDLPADRLRPPAQSWRGASTSLTLSQELTEGLRTLAGHDGATTFEALLTALIVLLARYSGQTDIVVGSVTPDRHLSQARVVGPLADPTIVRAELSGNPSFRQLLQHVRRMSTQGRAHNSVPFARLLKQLQVERSLSHAPIFQVLVNLKPPRGATRQLEGLSIDPFEFDPGIASFDLTVHVVDGGERLECQFEYNSDLFDCATISRKAAHFDQLLASVAANPDGLIHRLPLMPEADRQRVLRDWNNTAQHYRESECIHRRFESQVLGTPNATAVVFDDERVTYGQLNARANQLAHYLRTRGVAPETPVGICLSRSINMVVAVLAVLKAGGAYVPLDPAYPTARLQYMLKDAGVAVLITESDLLGVVPATEHIICVDVAWETIGCGNESNPLAGAVPDNLAYVIYTSGSTGNPKGVGIQHCSTMALLRWAYQVFSPRDLAGVLASTSLCFDLSVFELFAPLCSGGTVLLARNALQLGDRRFGQVTIVNTVPSVMTEVVQAGNLPSSARTVNLAGEPLPNSLAQRIYAQGTVSRVFNLYGPTEDTTYSTFALVTIGATEEPSIGVPISNSRAYVLDSYFEPVPVGVAGELYLGGDGLARGYLNRGALTAEKFVPDPFSGQTGARLYRTGDLARFRTDGTLQFLGRIDHQVKIRGFRIELGEVEATLKTHPSVVDAAVIPTQKNDGLVAYVVIDRAQPPDGEPLVHRLRNHVAKKLPDYMTPAVFVQRPALPLTPNGKVDRRALPRASDANSGRRGHVPPRDDMEAALCRLWEKILGVTTVGIADNFFELGGHSLLAARLFAQIENRFNTRLPLATLFEAPTVEQLASVLRRERTNDVWSSLVAIQPHGTRPPLFCVHAAGANVLIYRPLARHLSLDQPVYALQACGLDGRTTPHTRVEPMASHYVAQIKQLQPVGPYYLLGGSFGGLVIFEMAQQMAADGQRVALLAMLNTNCPVYSALGRIKCHLGHLKEAGAVGYVRGAARALHRRLVKESPAGGVNGIPDRVLREAVRNHLDTEDPLVRTVLAIFEAERAYVPARYPGKITFFWANDSESGFDDNRRGWQTLAAGGFELHKIPGTHTSMREEPYVATLAEELAACLEQAQAAHASSSTRADKQ
jgi:amino acid adenylation domain-containing protein